MHTSFESWQVAGSLYVHIFVSAAKSSESSWGRFSVIGLFSFEMASMTINRADTRLCQGDDQVINVSIPKDSFDTYNIDPPPYSLETSKSELRELYKDMTTIR